ncbi:hypothetical protein CPU12_07810 [Malaciobacter molluscorum LMG 25693]|uniref:Membrane protein n=1 Tax=Malaciobacter molluscorum LMG 25693 TaxID=870501 RepID=A0A2G1DHM5_9BACT|nr:hypothetical protein [Malaciobacter molluscorum]AXX93339.1 putative membrane protein [Malaciobacter molluscorum LMG 25693]PHO17993.1 hypothetical protein CPU12_07810 [Malaciobacter molluscorum LMG 25693]
MNDKNKQIKLKKYALGNLFCWFFMIVISIIFSKEYGRTILFTIIPIYSVFYIFIYHKITRSYKDPNKRLLAFGIIARGTLTGAMYYLSIFIVIIICSLLFLTLYTLYIK